MKQSKLFTKTQKNSPADEESKNAKLLIQAGYISKEMAGVYSFLPLGLIVLEKINKIIKEEMEKIGGQEILMSALQCHDVWQESGRWDDKVVDVWFKTFLKSGGELGLGFSHEEPLTKNMKNFICSYKDLPFYPYQIQTKFRNEKRAKSGLMRGREFLMKDLYSFSKDEKEHNDFYEKISEAYFKIFERLDLKDLTYKTFADGGSFSKYSHEFQTESDAGEDIVYLDREKKIAINQEVYTDEVIEDLGLKKENLEKVKTAETGNIFTLGTKFSDALNLKYKDEKGEDKSVFMGSYGIGPSRIMGLLVEIFSDEKGIVWPKSVSPFLVHLVSLEKNEEAEKIYQKLKENNIEVLFDDREKISAGEKFSDSDLLGISYRVIVSEKSLNSGGFEVKKREEKEAKILSEKNLLDFFISEK